MIIHSGQKCAVAVEGVVDPGNVLNDTMSVSSSTLTNEHSKNIAKSSDEHNEHSRNTSNVTDAHTSETEYSDAELKECSRDPSYTINAENTNLVAKTFGQNEHSSDTLNLTETCGTDTNDSDAELKGDQEVLDHQQDLAGDALPSVVQFDNLENHIYQCAPSENNIPKYILLDEDFVVLPFHDLLPYGYGGYFSQNGPQNLPIRKYFQ